MDTVILKADRNNIDREGIAEAGRIIRQGGLVAFPTETVYGLGGDALNPESSKKIYAAKGRPSDNPLIVHIADIEDIYRIVSVDDRGYSMKGIEDKLLSLAGAFWPGPLTIILNKRDEVPYETTGGLDTVAVRMPSDDIAREFIRCAGGYIAAPSANTSGRPSPTMVKHVIEDMDGRIDMIIDGGDVDIGVESTIIDLTDKQAMILRPGAVTIDMLRDVLGEVIYAPNIRGEDKDKAPKAPGMKYRHYAPKGELTVVKGPYERVVRYINDKAALYKSELMKVGVICVDEHVLDYKAEIVRCIGKQGDDEEASKRLYSILRDFDTEGVEVIYSEELGAEGIGVALRNRLLKAAGQRIVDTKAAEA